MILEDARDKGADFVGQSIQSLFIFINSLEYWHARPLPMAKQSDVSTCHYLSSREGARP